MLFGKPPKRAKKKRERFDPKLRTEVLLRDKACVAWLVGWPHVCRDASGREHSPTDWMLLSIEHVKPEIGMSVPRLHRARWCVALCYMLNLQPPPKALRERFRDYLSRLPTR